ncbi:MAG: hypothetical protein GXO19_04610 [Epsilonproteobacteria bacterium]|nr:hypothetical protein [Campylobacterota bacterium]NPA57000.1 hypothetical protein [Campylobacterota bacterium]
MKRTLLLILPFLLLVIALIFKGGREHLQERGENRKKEETLQLDPSSPHLVEEYTFHVIMEGSESLGFPTKMEGGYVKEDEARKIAAYIATLHGETPSHREWVQEGAALFYGNCTGCHQKGVKEFPDLQRRPLLGIERIKNRVQ